MDGLRLGLMRVPGTVVWASGVSARAPNAWLRVVFTQGLGTACSQRRLLPASQDVSTGRDLRGDSITHVQRKDIESQAGESLGPVVDGRHPG